jgi:hypothetical protein
MESFAAICSFQRSDRRGHWAPVRPVTARQLPVAVRLTYWRSVLAASLFVAGPAAISVPSTARLGSPLPLCH